MEPKVEIITTGDKVLFGNDIIELKDNTRQQFTAVNPVKLKEYLEDIEEPVNIYIGKSLIEVYDVGELDHNSHPMGRSEILEHPIVNLLRHINSKQQDLNAFLVTLQRIKPYGSQDAISLIDNVNDLKIKKIISINNRNDRRGNYEYSVKAEKSDAKEYEFPKSIKLNIPLIKGMTNNDGIREVEFNFFFQWGTDGSGDVQLNFTLENLELDTFIEEEIQSILYNLFESLSDSSIYYGGLFLHKETDEWKYKRNELQIKS